MTADTVVVGGGIAGSALAILLARAGRQVTLLEQHPTARHKVCGEFLSQEALDYLERLGIDVLALGAQPIHRLRLCAGRRSSETLLGFRAASLTRKRLDEALLEQAVKSGVIVLRGERVEQISNKQTTCLVRTGQGREFDARHVFLASGKHDVHDIARPQTSQSGMLAFKQYFRLRSEMTNELSSTTELFAFHGGYAGLQPVEDGLANLCLIVDGNRYKQFHHGWNGLLDHLLENSPLLRDRLISAEAILEKPLALSSIPYGYLYRAQEEPGSFWRLGDQAAVIPSLTGDGMSIALHSAFLAASCHLRGISPEEYAKRLQRSLQSQMKIATGIAWLLLNPKLSSLVITFTAIAPWLLGQAASITRIKTAYLSASQRIYVHKSSKCIERNSSA